MSATEAQISAALYALITVTQPGPSALGFMLSDTKLRDFSTVPPEMQPAIFQTYVGETSVQRMGTPQKTTHSFRWTIIARASTPDTNAEGTLSTLIRNLQTIALAPDTQGGPWNACTLSGLVYRVWQDGRILRNSGDANGQGSASIPVSVLVP